MNREFLIADTYRCFACYPKPMWCTVHDDDCPECMDHNATLAKAQRNTLSMEDIGPVSWCPVPFMNAAAMAHFLPRLIELALLNPDDPDGEPYAVRFVQTVSEGPDGRQFQLLHAAQRKRVLRALEFIKGSFPEMVARECIGDPLSEALCKWRKESEKGAAKNGVYIHQSPGKTREVFRPLVPEDHRPNE